MPETRCTSCPGPVRSLGRPRGLLPLLTHLDQGLAGHGVPGVDHFPAGRVDQRAAKSVLAVPHQAGLKL